MLNTLITLNLGLLSADYARGKSVAARTRGPQTQGEGYVHMCVCTQVGLLGYLI